MGKNSLNERFNSASTLTKAMVTAGALLAILVVLMVLTSIGRSATTNGSVQRTEVTAPTRPATQDIQTIVVRQDAEGYTNEDLTPETVKLIENEIIDRSLQRAKESMKAQGLSEDLVTREMFKSSSWITEVNGRRFGIVDQQAATGRIKAIISIQSGQFIRLSCVNLTGANITNFTGPCAAKIEEIFGVKLPSANS